MPGIRWSDRMTATSGSASRMLERLGPALAGEDLVVEPEQVVDRAEDFRLVVDHQELGTRPVRCMVDVPSMTTGRPDAAGRIASVVGPMRLPDPCHASLPRSGCRLDVERAGSVTRLPAANRLISVTSLPASL